MLEISETQKRILKLLILNQPDDKKKGLSGYEIGELGVARRTFEINQEDLLYYQLIKIAESKQAGTQERKYFRVTPLGFFTLLKSMEIEEIQENIHMSKFCDFIPLIGNYWGLLLAASKENDEFLITVLKYSLNALDLIPVAKKETHDALAKIFNENTTIQFEQYHFSLTFKRMYTVMTQDEIDYFDFVKKTDPHAMTVNDMKLPNQDALHVNIVERLTFLFYFNLVKFISDYSYSAHIYSNLPSTLAYGMKYKQNTKENFVEYDAKNFEKKLHQWEAIPLGLLLILNKDEKLVSLLRSNTDEIKNIFNVPPPVNAMVHMLDRAPTMFNDKES